METKSTGKVKPKSNAASGLTDLFEAGLKDIYWAEKAQVRALTNLLKNITSPELSQIVIAHQNETDIQIVRLEKVFEIIGKKVEAKKCEAMQGLIEESEGIIKETEIGVVRDAGIIAAMQKIEHYEIATYGTLRQFAWTLGYTNVADLLQVSLNEEKNADMHLTLVAVDAVNIEAEKET